MSFINLSFDHYRSKSAKLHYSLFDLFFCVEGSGWVKIPFDRPAHVPSSTEATQSDCVSMNITIIVDQRQTAIQTLLTVGFISVTLPPQTMNTQGGEPADMGRQEKMS